MKASFLDFSGSYFKKSEFPEGVLDSMDSSVINALFSVRCRLPVDHFLYPSPLYGAHVRDDNSGSRHNTQGNTRLSDATDFFCLRGQVSLIYQTVLATPSINGFGVYHGSTFMGNDDMWAMMHIDTRPALDCGKTLWVAEKVGGAYQYTYLHKDPKKYFEVLSKVCR